MDFAGHLRTLLALSTGGAVELTFHPPLRAADFAGRKALAQAAADAVSATFIPAVMPAGGHAEGRGIPPAWGPHRGGRGALSPLGAGRRAVRLRLDGADHPMRRDGEGWFEASAPAAAGAAYGFVLDDGARCPIRPRGRRSGGVHGRVAALSTRPPTAGGTAPGAAARGRRR